MAGARRRRRLLPSRFRQRRRASHSSRRVPARSRRFAEQLLDRQQALGVRHLQQSQLQVEALLLAVSQLAVGAQHNLQVPRQVFLAEQFRRPRYPLPLVARNLQQRRLSPGHFGDHGVAQKPHQLPREMGRIMSLGQQLVHQPQSGFARSLGHSLH